MWAHFSIFGFTMQQGAQKPLIFFAKIALAPKLKRIQQI